MRVVKSFSLDTEIDQDLIERINDLENGKLSQAVRTGLRIYFQTDCTDPTLDDIFHLLLQMEARLHCIQQFGPFSRPPPPPSPPDKPKAKANRGNVYLLRAGPYYKIGVSTQVDERIKQLSTLPPFDIELLHTLPTDDMYKLEKQLHERYADKRKNGEWFELDQDDVEYIKGL
jgi:hypothetical protein